MKKFYFLACLSVVFLLGCSADGYMRGGGDPGDTFSPGNPNSPFNGIPSDFSNTGSCVHSGEFCEENVLQDDCDRFNSFSPSECNRRVYLYCAYYHGGGDYCFLIGGSYVKDKNECLSISSSVFATREYCLTRGYGIYE